jgi:ABC-type branched-subunit amino acid transport system substrate-binding protein
MRRNTPIRVWIVLSVVTALALTACGSSNKSSSATTAGSSASTASSSASTAKPASAACQSPGGSPIKLVTFYQAKTGLAPDATLPDGAAAAVKEVNCAGGINGRPLSWSTCDDLGSNTQARTCATNAINDGVIAAVGTVTTEANIYLPLFAQAGLPNIGAYANAAQDFTSTASFPIAAGPSNSPAAVTNALVREGAKKISLAYIAGSSTLVASANAGLKPYGMSLVGSVAIPANAPDMAPYVASAEAHGADGVEIFTLATDIINFVREMRSEGSTLKIGVVTNNYPQVFQELGSQANGIVDQNDYYPNNQTQIGAVQREVAAFQSAGTMAGINDPYAWNSYAAVMVFTAVAKKLPDVTRATVTAALSQTSNLDIGLVSPLQFVHGNKDNLAPRIFNDCVFLTRWTSNGYQGITPQWIDPQNNTVCPSPSSS